MEKRAHVSSGVSLLDKLIDHDPRNTADVHFPLNNQQIVRGLIRDVEALLNTRLSWVKVDNSLPELRQSLLTYGLPDFSSMPFSSKDGQQHLCKIVKDTLLEFEPRFKDVSVSIINDKDDVDRVLRLRISAVYELGQKHHELVLDSEVEPVSLGIKVSETA
ncbi:type VI secretion system baseplate subunit TssE [Vibrio penaeicida]|uniref:Lysozyme n=1 Tax=Vibrio penaeicida TaxID=104609 RepID=A0AAV5NL66_9VIBR|nr:type VI secretion system baseplate subunit TssE [Vibrio penaeicida]RTZ23124.1 type VI secretion system baseplate subunit TssE [Vibrio penaeicida]GLQ70786.1 lysozyme [Vibrio penaeicida]